MRKQILALAACVLLAMAPVCATEASPAYIAIGLGGNTAISVPFDSTPIANFHNSLEVRARVMWFDFSLVGSHTRLDGNYDEFSTFLGMGLCNRDARTLRIGIEIGPRFRWVFKDGKGYYLDDDGDPVRRGETLDYFAYSPVDYRLTVDYLLPCGVAVGGFYQVDTDYRFESWERVVDLVNLDWETGRLGFTCMYYFDL